MPLFEDTNGSSATAGAVSALPFTRDRNHPRWMGLRQRWAEIGRRKRRDPAVDPFEAGTIVRRQLCQVQYGRIAPEFRVLLTRLRLRRQKEVDKDLGALFRR